MRIDLQTFAALGGCELKVTRLDGVQAEVCVSRCVVALQADRFEKVRASFAVLTLLIEGNAHKVLRLDQIRVPAQSLRKLLFSLCRFTCFQKCYSFVGDRLWPLYGSTGSGQREKDHAYGKSL